MHGRTGGAARKVEARAVPAGETPSGAVEKLRPIGGAALATVGPVSGGRLRR